MRKGDPRTEVLWEKTTSALACVGAVRREKEEGQNGGENMPVSILLWDLPRYRFGNGPIEGMITPSDENPINVLACFGRFSGVSGP